MIIANSYPVCACGIIVNYFIILLVHIIVTVVNFNKNLYYLWMFLGFLSNIKVDYFLKHCNAQLKMLS